MDYTPSAMPWYKSKIIVGAAISILTKILVMTGLISEFTPEQSEVLVNTLVLVTGGIGDIVAISSRVVQKAAPDITLATTK